MQITGENTRNKASNRSSLKHLLCSDKETTFAFDQYINERPCKKKQGVIGREYLASESDQYLHRSMNHDSAFSVTQYLLFNVEKHSLDEK